MGTIVNRPLNAITTKTLRRLADFEYNSEYLKLDETQVIAEISLLESMEDDFIEENLPALQLSDEDNEMINYSMKAGQLLKENWKNFGSIESFNDLKKQFLIPRANQAFVKMLTSGNVTEEMKDKLDKIARQVNKLIAIIETIYGVKANNISKRLHKELNELMDDNDSFKSLKLSQKALLMIKSLDGISCTLVGMRQNKYVDDVISCLKLPAIENVVDKWERLVV